MLRQDFPDYVGQLLSRENVAAKMEALSHASGRKPKLTVVCAAIASDIEVDIMQAQAADVPRNSPMRAPVAVAGGAKPAPSVVKCVPDKAHDAQVVHQIRQYIDMIRRNDESAVLRSGANNIHFHGYVAKSKNPELSIWMALLAIGLMAARASGHLVRVGQGLTSPRAKSAPNDQPANGRF